LASSSYVVTNYVVEILQLIINQGNGNCGPSYLAPGGEFRGRTLQSACSYMPLTRRANEPCSGCPLNLIGSIPFLEVRTADKPKGEGKSNNDGGSRE
jgi:hypothetical protein